MKKKNKILMSWKPGLWKTNFACELQKINQHEKLNKTQKQFGIYRKVYILKNEVINSL